MKLLKIESEGVDIVLMVVEDDYDVTSVFNDAQECADMIGDMEITEEVIVSDAFADGLLNRPFVG